MEASAVAVSPGNTGPLGSRRGVGFGILIFITAIVWLVNVQSALNDYWESKGVPAP